MEINAQLPPEFALSFVPITVFWNSLLESESQRTPDYGWRRRGKQEKNVATTHFFLRTEDS
jgi:hypothetical protein